MKSTILNVRIRVRHIAFYCHVEYIVKYNNKKFEMFAL